MKTLAKILLAALSYVVGVMLSGALTMALHLPEPGPVSGASQSVILRNLALCSPLLIAGVAALACGLGGPFFARFGALFALIYVCVGVNTAIEAAVFISTMAQGVGPMFLHYVLPSAFAAGTLAWLFRSGQPAPALPGLGARQWSWRLLTAWLAFPVIYLIFGMCVAPFVLASYHAGTAGLRIPAGDIILQTQLLRSALFLLASLPIVLLWTRSRRNLLVSLGIAYAVMVGIFGLAQAFWMPTVLRIAHGIEITADSFAYAGVLVWLLTKRSAAPQLSCMQAAASFRVE